MQQQQKSIYFSFLALSYLSSLLQSDSSRPSANAMSSIHPSSCDVLCPLRHSHRVNVFLSYLEIDGFRFSHAWITYAFCCTVHCAGHQNKEHWRRQKTLRMEIWIIIIAQGFSRDPCSAHVSCDRYFISIKINYLSIKQSIAWHTRHSAHIRQRWLSIDEDRAQKCVFCVVKGDDVKNQQTALMKQIHATGKSESEKERNEISKRLVHPKSITMERILIWKLCNSNISPTDDNAKCMQERMSSQLSWVNHIKWPKCVC